MLIKVSHESPISILEKSKDYNDFDYALVHLFDQFPEYYSFYKNSRNLYNREVLLDNSIFELGKSFDPNEYFVKAKDLKPNLLIVPDMLEDSDGTVNSFVEFREKLIELKSQFELKSIGVVQGRNWHELKNCYRFISYEADVVAISFDYSYYHFNGEGDTPLERFCSGRQRLISELINSGIWEWSKPHHLLGCSLAKEFRYYVDRDVYNIVSCDTSNPIVAAIHGLKYNSEYGLQTKPTTKLADLIKHEFTDDELSLVDYNVAMFKKILRR